MARPELTVVLAAGDGDIFAIGGNHFIHAARRNLDMTLIVYDNRSYGMTGAQYSPTSPLGESGTSAPFGVFEPPFNLVNLALGAGASFVAQGAVTTLAEHQEQLDQLIAGPWPTGLQLRTSWHLPHGLGYATIKVPAAATCRTRSCR
jgi:2-oxoglutarate ferredoxin oxidoreductase subunit beta